MRDALRSGAPSLDEVLAAYIEEVEAGRRPDQSALLVRYPDHAVELREFFANHADLASLPRAFRSATTPPADEGAPWSGGPPTGEWTVGAGVHAEMTIAFPSRFGDYELRREIARGGMGVVYEARQVSLNRVVALKKIRPDQFETARMVERFHAEAEAAAHLDHPNIVPIYEVNEVEGQHYYTMKLIQGRGLDSRLEEFALPRTDRRIRKVEDRTQKRIAVLLAEVARAVHHAHLRGVLHRDLKPANILLEDVNPEGDGAPGVGDPPVKPVLTDFGLSKRVSHDGQLTQSMSIVGTPCYMAPEQAAPRAFGLTTAADVYSLGSILYELLTGQLPFRGRTVYDTLIQVIETPPVPPRRINPAVSADLEAICLKCLEKDPGRRYPSALALAEDLECWTIGRPISLRAHGPAERAWRWGRRNPALAGLLLTLAGLLLAGLVGSTWAAIRIAAARDEAIREGRAAATSARHEKQARLEADRARTTALGALEAEKTEREENRRLLVAQYIANGSRELDAGDLFGSLPWYAAALQEDSGNPLREAPHRVRLAAALRRCPRLVQAWFFDQAEVTGVFARDGRSLILTSGTQARRWSIASGAAVTPPLALETRIVHTALSDDGRKLATIGDDHTVRLWDAATGQAVGRPLKHDQAVLYVSFSPDGGRVATASADLTARVWDASRGRPVTPPLKHDYPVQSAVFSRDGKRLITAATHATDQKGEAILWETATGKELQRVRLPRRAIRWAALTPDGKTIIIQGQLLRLTLVEQGTGRALGTPFRIGAGPPEVGFAPDGVHALKVEGTTAQPCDLLTGQGTGPVLAHGAEVRLAAFSPDGRLVLTAGADRSVRVWEAATGRRLTPPLRHGRRVASAAFNRDGTLLSTVCDDGTVRVWEIAPRELALAPIPPRPLESSALSPDGRLAAVIAKDGRVTLRDALTDRPVLGPWTLPEAAVHRLAFSPDGRRLALGTADARIQVRDVATGEATTPVLEGVGLLEQLLFTPNSRQVAMVGTGDRLRIWTASGGALTVNHTFGARTTWRPLSLGAEGGVFVTRANQEIKLRTTRTGAVWLGPLKAAVPLTIAAMSPDGKRLAAGSVEGTVYFWDVATGHPRPSPLHHGQPLQRLVWSCDSRRLATVAQDRGVRVWDTLEAQPLTPMLEHPEPLHDVTFSPDGTRLVTVGKTGGARVWDLSGDDRPVADLRTLTELLSGQSLDGPTGGFVPVDAAGLRAVWPELRARYPHEFSLAAP